jgi:hypothetical protein
MPGFQITRSLDREMTRIRLSVPGSRPPRSSFCRFPNPDSPVFPEVNRACKAAKSGTDPSNPGPTSCIQSHVTGSGLIKRVFIVTVVAAGLLAFLGATGYASPIRPNIKKVLSQPSAPMPQYVPARAGWNGPEISTARTAPNPTYESLSPARAARELRSSLLATMMPDMRILALIALVILLLRRIRNYQQAHATAGVSAQNSVASTPSRAASLPALPVPVAAVPPSESSTESEEAPAA